jgi:hypothetical protein
MWNFNGTDYGRWKRGRGGNGVRPFSEGKTGRRRGGSTVPEADDTTKSGLTIWEAEGDNWRIDVEDHQRKLGRWTECAVGPNC